MVRAKIQQYVVNQKNPLWEQIKTVEIQGLQLSVDKFPSALYSHCYRFSP